MADARKAENAFNQTLFSESPLAVREHLLSLIKTAQEVQTLCDETAVDLHLSSKYETFGEAMAEQGFDLYITENKDSVTFTVNEHENYPVLYSKTNPGDVWVYQIFKKEGEHFSPVYACSSPLQLAKKFSKVVQQK